MRRFWQFLPIFALLLAACAPPAGADVTNTPATSGETQADPTATTVASPEATAAPTEAVGPALDVTLLAHSTRDDKALSDPPGGDWEGLYSWTPYVLYHEGQFHMFYNGFQSLSRGIGYATSSDGLHFERSNANPVFEAPLPQIMTIGPVVYVDDDGSWVMYLIEDNHRSSLAGGIVMRYTAPGPEGPWTVSNEGEPVYEAPLRHWTAQIVLRSIALVDGEIWLAFHARHEDNTVDIGILRSADGLSFELLVDQPVLSPGPEGAWDGYAVGAPILNVTEDGFEMFYLGMVPRNGFLTSAEGENYFFGYATSQDGIHWQKAANNPVVRIPEGGGFSYSSGFMLDGVYYIYYVYDAGRSGLGAAILEIE